MKHPPKEIVVPIVGVSFIENGPEKIHAIGEMVDTARRTGESVAAVLIRNPANEYDEFAIEVHVPALGDDGMIGHVPKKISTTSGPLNRIYAQAIDRGERFLAEIPDIRVHPDHPENPGIDLRIVRVDHDEDERGAA